MTLRHELDAAELVLVLSAARDPLAVAEGLVLGHDDPELRPTGQRGMAHMLGSCLIAANIWPGFI